MTLPRDIRTPIGTYSAGTPVEVICRTAAGVVVRLPRANPAAMSWTVTLPERSAS